MTATTSAAILSIQAAADQLQTSPLIINRLISRSALAGTQLGSSGQFAVTQESLAAYVQAGARDFDPPPIRVGWFDPEDTRPANDLAGAIRARMGGLSPDEATVQRWFNVKQQARYDVETSPAEIQSIATAPPPKSIMPNASPWRYKSWAAMYLAAAWREALRNVSGIRTVDALYNPATFKANLDAAWNEVMKSMISATSSKTYFPTDSRGEQHHARVAFTFPVARLTGFASREYVESVAF